MTTVTEIAPDVYRISAYESNFKLQFNLPVVREAVARLGRVRFPERVAPGGPARYLVGGGAANVMP